MTQTPTLVVLAPSGTDTKINGQAQTPTLVEISNPEDISLGGSLSSNLDGEGFSISNFSTWAGSVVSLGADGATAALVATLTGLAVSSTFLATVGLRATIWKTDKSSAGSIDLLVEILVTTDGEGAVTCSLQGVTPVPDASRLPAALAGATLAVAASAGGFTVSVSRPTGVACKTFVKGWNNKIEVLS